MGASLSFSLPPRLKHAVEEAAREWQSEGRVARVWEKDASLWTNSGEEKSLGWLDIVDREIATLSRLKALEAEVKEDGFRHIVLLGMGALSLCGEVFSRIFGQQKGSPELLLLDSTDPVQIKSLRNRIDPARTLFCVSSKSGATFETNLFLRYFYDETKKAVGVSPGDHFIAVTDPGSDLERAARELGFRYVYHGMNEIEASYSALSDFGLVPHAAMGLDTEKLLQAAKCMVELCRKPEGGNPGAQLGVVLGVAAAKFARDKVTLFCSRAIGALGAWIEQLLADSTGKMGRGLIPLADEPRVLASEYGNDRIFVSISYAKDDDPASDALLSQLERSGQPVVRIAFDDLYDIGQMFFLWQFAAAAAASVLGVNPFDQRGVEAGEVTAHNLTGGLEKTGLLTGETPILEQDELKLLTDATNAAALRKTGARTMGDYLRAHLDRVKTGDYFGLLAYIPMLAGNREKLQEIRKHMLEAKGVATVLGFGPRFLHGAGKAYKEGPNSGVFIQITCEDEADIPVPGQKYTFGFVKAAQARDEFQALAARDRRAIRIHLGRNLDKGLDQFSNLMSAVLSH